MSKTKVTKDRFEDLKRVVDLLNNGNKGNGEVYKALNISSATASRIKRSANFGEYVAIRAKDTARPVKQQTTLTQHKEKLDKVLANINVSLMEVIDLQHKILNKLEQKKFIL